MPRPSKRRRWGSGSLFERDGRWWIRWRENGGRKCKSFASRDLASQVLAQIVADIELERVQQILSQRKSVSIERLPMNRTSRVAENASPRVMVDYGLEWLNRVGSSLHGQLHCEVFRVSPEDAAAILERAKGANFRKASTAHVDRLARAMLCGKWFENGEPIHFNDEGLLINGQHRLMAIVKSGVTLDLSVVFNADWRGLDNQLRRTIGNNMTHIGAKDGKGVAGVLKLVMARASGRVRWPENMDKDNNFDIDIEAIYESDRSMADEAAKYCSAKQHAVLPGTVAGWLHYETSRAGLRAECEQFIAVVNSGENLSRQSPCYWLRERILGVRRVGRIPRVDLIELVILAWNKYIRDEPCLMLRSEKTFPTIVLSRKLSKDRQP